MLELVRLLSDGEFHSGTELAEQLGVSRTSVWNSLKKIQSRYKLEIHTVKGRGYRLPGGLELLDRQKILSSMTPGLLSDKDIDLFHDITSTNQYLLDREMTHDTGYRVCLAEMQSAGRGRRGRGWASPFGTNIYLSVGCMLSLPMNEVSGLSLAAGVAVAETLEEAGIQGVGLKWPNDIHWQGKKLAGLLLEVRGEAEGPVKVVIGLGLNMYISAAERTGIDQDVCDLKEIAGEHVPERNGLIANLLDKLFATVESYKQTRLSSFIDRWSSFDCYRDSLIDLVFSDGSRVEGVCCGISDDGRIRVETGDGIVVYSAGEVSLRKTVV